MKIMYFIQVLETVSLMSSGFPHRMRYKAFNARYKCLAFPSSLPLYRTDERAVDDCDVILDCYNRALKAIGKKNPVF